MTAAVLPTRSDLRLLEQAIRNRWEIPESIYAAVPATLANILLKGTNREKLAAAKVFAEIVKQNNEPDTKIGLVAHKHTHEVITASAEDIERKRQELIARAARLG